MMSALYDSLLSYGSITIFHEHYATDLLLKGSEFRGFLALELATGQPRYFAAKAGIIATGGFARIYGFTTTAYSSTGDGIALAYKAGLPLKDMEFVQFHPTCLIPTGVLITEAARGEGGYLVDSHNRRFMEDYAKSKMELAPRDIVSRAMITELAQGRGLLHEVSGMHHLLLDLRHIGEEKIDERLPMIKEISMKLLGINPSSDPLPVRPGAHYTMGGIHENLQGQVMSDDDASAVEGLWAAGECGCVSVHGANRLGSNSLSHCVIWGRITGEAAARKAMQDRSTPGGEEVKDELDAACGRLDALLSRAAKEDAYQLRRELGETMDALVHVYRDEQGLRKAETSLSALRERYGEVGVQDPSEVFNTNLRDVLEIGSMLELAQTVAAGALQRRESRGSHARVEYTARDDPNFLKHTLTYRTKGLPRISYVPVARTRWEPQERKY
jgi:succinate dehydrogenase / fumarate reductase flavoprotein subunit